MREYTNFAGLAEDAGRLRELAGIYEELAERLRMDPGMADWDAAAIYQALKTSDQAKEMAAFLRACALYLEETLYCCRVTDQRIADCFSGEAIPVRPVEFGLSHIVGLDQYESLMAFVRETPFAREMTVSSGADLPQDISPVPEIFDPGERNQEEGCVVCPQK